ncbi:hypothetical protein GIX45_06720 [Erwinia sp. CPCC 100877]|nr:hypothetical protein [Erwinia sp. CPCC 100877]
MKYLGITIASSDKEFVENVTERYKRYTEGFIRIYKSQNKIEGTENKRWAYFILIKIDEQVFFKDSTVLENMPNKFEKAVIRIEILEETPNSVLEKNSLRKGLTIIEHVNVGEPYLKEFKQIMIHNNTPAMDYIIKNKKWCNEFIALETAIVIYHNENYCQWNQIHLVNMSYSAPFLYKKDFNEGLKKAGDPSFEENFLRLTKIREFTYKYKCKLIK